MLTEQLREDLLEMLRQDPKKAMAEIEKSPAILELLLNSDRQLEEVKKDRVRYVNMTQDLSTQLEQKAKQLKVSQGILIGAGVLFLLSLLDEK